MHLRHGSVAGLVVAWLFVTPAVAQQQTVPFARLPQHVFDATPPAVRVSGTPGAMTMRAMPCRNLPLATARQRIVDLAVQEWAYFGFPIVEYDEDEDAQELPAATRGDGRGADPQPGRRRGPSRIGTPEAARTAASIGGYWAVTPGGSWILDRQNEHWRDALSGVTRWRFPWSAAFISWLMCEGGIGTSDAFQRAIAHHTYIDQAIRARDSGSTAGAYVAYDVGEAPIAPGDMLCSSRRPVFRTLAARRAQMGQGARTHCDVVVKVDAAALRIVAVGGNVRGVVGLKLFPAVNADGRLRPALPPSTMLERPLFAHLRLRGTAPSLHALDASPTMRALACGGTGATTGARPAMLRQLIPSAAVCAD